MGVVIYHNPRCSKSRQTLVLLREHGVEPKIVEYLQDPPSAATLKKILRALQMSPRQLLRTGEAAYREHKLADTSLDDDRIIAAMVGDPILIERPIVVNGNRAAIGRPPEAVLAIL